MTTIYVVTHGEYSDYTIEGVFSSEENALLMFPKDPHDLYPYTIEEYELDLGVDKRKQGYKWWQVCLWEDNGNVYSVKEEEDIRVKEYGEYTWRDRIEKHRFINAYVFLAKNREHAIKIASEKLAHEKATPEPKYNKETGVWDG
jgi:hypothetical protein